MGFAIVFAVLLLILMVGGFLGFRYACCPLPDPDWDDPASIEKSMWKDHPISIPQANQWLRDHGAEDVSVMSHDGLRLVGKWVRAERPIGTIILFHGYHSHYLTDFGGIFQRYHDIGLNMLMVRQRAHGESEGKYITFGVRERLDVLQWIEFHNKTHGKDNVYLGGMSMGTATVLFAAGEELPDNVRGITADCGFTSPAEILALTCTKTFHFPGQLLLPFVNVWSRLLAGFGVWECNTRKTLARAKVPILFIHGKADDFVPCWMTEAGYEACAGEKQIYLVEGAGHGMAYMMDKVRIRGALTEFFTGHLSPEYAMEDVT